MQLTFCNNKDNHDAPNTPHVALEDIREVEIAGKPFHFFRLGSKEHNNSLALINNVWLRVSEVVEGFQSAAIYSFLTHLKSCNSPEYVWLRQTAVTPVRFLEALRFWQDQSQRGDPWAKRVVQQADKVEQAILVAFGLIDKSLAADLTWEDWRDGGLRVRQIPGRNSPLDISLRHRK